MILRHCDQIHSKPNLIRQENSLSHMDVDHAALNTTIFLQRMSISIAITRLQGNTSSVQHLGICYSHLPPCFTSQRIEYDQTSRVRQYTVHCERQAVLPARHTNRLHVVVGHSHL